MRQVKVVFVLTCVALFGLGMATCGSALKSWSPIGHAEAEIMLRTPIPVPTPRPPATLSPEIVEAQNKEDVATIGVRGVATRTVLYAAGVAAAVVLAAVCGLSISATARHTLATIRLDPMVALPRGSHVLLPSGIFDKRGDSLTVIDEGNQAADHETHSIAAGRDAAMIAALVQVLNKPAAARTRGDRAMVDHLLTK